MPKENPKKTESAPKGNNQPRLLGWLILLVLFVAVSVYLLTLDNEPGERVVINGKNIAIEIADEPEEIIKGLGGRDELDANSGMLFIFPNPITPSFWMKDMQFPIDVVWIDENLEIIAITPSLPVESFPDSVSPPGPVKYVLEVNAGYSAYSGWLAGDKVELYLD